MGFFREKIIGTEQHTSKTWIKFGAIVLICFVLLIGVFVSISGADSEKNRATSLIFFNTTTELPLAGSNKVYIYLDVATVNLDSFSLRLRTDFIASGLYGKGNTFNQTVKFVQDSATKIIPAGINPSPITNPVFLNGDINLYPFDVYTSVIDLQMFQNGSTIFDSTPVPIAAVFSGARTGYNFLSTQIVASGNVTAGQASVFLEMSRSNSVKILVMILVVFQWLIAITSFAVAIDILIRMREIHPSLLAFFGIMLIALPALRNSQPNAPAIGTFTDIFGFEWNMILLTIAFVIGCALFVFRRPRPPTDDQTKATLEVQPESVDKKASAENAV